MAPHQNGNGSHSEAKQPTASGSKPIPTLVTVDPRIPAHEQKNIHTRWHPDIPAVCEIVEGEAFRVECMDYSGESECRPMTDHSGFQIRNDDVADDVLDMDHDSDHHVSGPFWVPSAQPGDALEIDILE